MLAVRREPGEPDGAAGDYRRDVDLPDALAKMAGLRVIHCVHRDRLGIVIDGDVDRAADRALDRRAGAATACKVVYDQFVFRIMPLLQSSKWKSHTSPADNPRIAPAAYPAGRHSRMSECPGSEGHGIRS
jgi:hypothetical protein